MTPQQAHHDLSNGASFKGLRAHLQPLAGDVRLGTHEFYRQRAECATSLPGHCRIKLVRAAPA